MRKIVLAVLAVLVMLSGGGLSGAQAASSADVPRMTVDQLNASFEEEADSDVIILDVRTGNSWTKSPIMIKTAVRENPGDFMAWVKKYPKEATITLYCT